MKRKKMVALVVTDRRGLTRNRKHLAFRDTFFVDWNQSHSHVDRWLKQGRIRIK